MKRNVGKKTVHLFRNLLQRKFEEALKEIKDDFRHDFTYEKPYFDLTIRVDAYDFATTVMETEIVGLTRKLARAEQTIKLLTADVEHSTDPITETLHETSRMVMAHQKKGDWHRLVDCNNVPQPVSAWTHKDKCIHFQGFVATWEGDLTWPKV